MNSIKKISLILVLLFGTIMTYSQCDTYLQNADAFFAQKNYIEAKKQYENYKECKPNATGIDAKIAECDRIIRGGAPIPEGTPDIETIKKGLIGKKIQDKHGGYFSDNSAYGRNTWVWTIETNEIKYVEIKTSKKNGNAFFLDVHLILQAKSSSTQYEFELQIVFVLNENNNWIIDNIATKDIYLVKTNRYDHCVTVETVENRGWTGSSDTKKSYTALNFTNNCNVSLVICGEVLSEGKWKKFYTNIEANKETRYFSNPAFTVYKIDYIEKK